VSFDSDGSDCRIRTGSDSTLYFEAELLESFDHHLSIFAPECALQSRFAVCQSCQIKARLVMLLEPGTVISVRTGLCSGTISMRSGMGIGATFQAIRSDHPQYVHVFQREEKSGRGRPHSKTLARGLCVQLNPRGFWSAAVLCRFASLLGGHRNEKLAT